MYVHVCPETVSDLVMYPFGFINFKSNAHCVLGAFQYNSSVSLKADCREDGWSVLGMGCQCPSGYVSIANGRTCRRKLILITCHT